MLDDGPPDRGAFRFAEGTMTTRNRTMVIVDASYFPHNPGDLVEEGVALGVFQGRRVDAPFRAKIESIAFDADEHALHVVLAETPR
jgi:hypothetical protein